MRRPVEEKPLLVGEAPSRTSGGFLVPFDPRSKSGARLEQLLGRPLLSVFVVRNLLPEWPGGDPRGKGSAWDREFAREAAVEIMREEWTRGRLLVLAGRRVARSFGVSSWPYLEVVGENFPAVVFPHPSGVDHWWNEPENVEAARHFLREVASRSAPA